MATRALDANGALFCWGQQDWGAAGMLGDGHAFAETPVPVIN